MAYRPLTQIDIGIKDVGVTAQGFGTPIFISSHRYFPERVRAYTSLTAAAEDLPTDSPAYIAVREFLSSTPSPSVVKVGRQEADLDLSVASGATSASLTFYATDGVNTYSLPIDITGATDEDDVATQIESAISGDSDIGALVTTSVSTNTVSITPASASDAFYVANLSSELTEAYTSSETAAEVLTAIEDEDEDFYFITAEDHSETFVLAMAEEAEARLKLYFTSSQEQGAITPYSEGAATDTLGKLADTNYLRTKGFFHHLADTAFPECTYVGINATADAGTVIWTNLPVSLPISQDPSTGNKLSATQKGYLEDRKAAYVDVKGGINHIRNDETASGTPIDTIRGRDNMEVDMDTAYANLLLSQNQTKLPFNDAGIGVLKQTCIDVLRTYVSRGFIEPNFIDYVDFPLEDQVPLADKEQGIYQLGSWAAELTGGIKFVGPITGSLTLRL